MSDTKFRLITRADFDGIVCGTLLQERDMIDDVLFAEPWEMQQGQVEVGSSDIAANLPYVPGGHLFFDHHASETSRVGDLENVINNPTAPSAARVIYEHYGGADGFPEISPDLIDEVDRADSAAYSIEDILAPDDWTLLNFILDPRTGLSRHRQFETPDRELMILMMNAFRHTPVKEILQLPEVQERILAYTYEAEFHERQIVDNARFEGKTIVVDLRSVTDLHPGNRFLIYGLFPEYNVSVVLKPTEPEDGRIEIAVGRSIMDRSSEADIGAILLGHGGGGHAAVGTCRVPESDVDRVVADILSKL